MEMEFDGDGLGFQVGLEKNLLDMMELIRERERETR